MARSRLHKVTLKSLSSPATIGLVLNAVSVFSSGRTFIWQHRAGLSNKLSSDLVFLNCNVNKLFNQSINQSIYIVQRRVLQCGYAESKRNVLRRILNVLTDGAVRQFSGREFQSLGAATEKRRAAVSKLCGGTDRSSPEHWPSELDWCTMEPERPQNG